MKDLEVRLRRRFPHDRVPLEKGNHHGKGTSRQGIASVNEPRGGGEMGKPIGVGDKRPLTFDFNYSK